uniref:Uncharacterized protein n=1 Tax=Arundo donax TaxID=35708 RepID=A0A0A8ZCH5_ARUDO
MSQLSASFNLHKLICTIFVCL